MPHDRWAEAVIFDVGWRVITLARGNATRSYLARHTLESSGLQLPPTSLAKLVAELRQKTARDDAVEAKEKATVTRAGAEQCRSSAELCFRRASGRWAGGETSVIVQIGSTPTAEGGSRTVWSGNGKWRGKDAYYSITIKPTWRRKVYDAGLATADGLLTLDAERISDDCWSAVWARQGRGFAVVVERGYIARCGRAFYHAGTVASAIRGAKGKAVEAERAYDRTPERLIALHGDLLVTMIDARKAGQCNPGIEALRNKYLDGRDTATVREMLTVDGNNPAVLATVLVAVARATAVK